MNFEIVFPKGKKKAVTLSYDDGQVFDRRLVKIFDQYGIKATFHLNSGKIGEEGFVTWEEVKELYQNHEISCHGAMHPDFLQLTQSMIVNEIWEDKKLLEKAVQYPMRGMSYPFGKYSDQLIQSFKCLGMEYSRTVNSTLGFQLPDDFMKWNPTCHHNSINDQLIDSFLNSPEYIKLPLFYVWGHSFEFDREKTWDNIEVFCEKISNCPDIWYATNIEIKEYITAFRGLICSVDQTIIYNPSAIPVWIKIEEDIISINPGKITTI